MRQKLKGRGHQPGARERCVLRKRRPVADRRYVVEVAAVDRDPTIVKFQNYPEGKRRMVFLLEGPSGKYVLVRCGFEEENDGDMRRIGNFSWTPRWL